MRRSDNLYLLVAIFALCAGLVTLAAGHPQEIAIMELVLAIGCAVLSLQSRPKE